MWIRRIVPDLKSEQLEESSRFYTELIGLEQVMDLGWIVCFASASNPTAQLQVISSDATAAPGVTAA